MEVTGNWRKLPEIAVNYQKLPKIAKNGSKSEKWPDITNQSLKLYYSLYIFACHILEVTLKTVNRNYWK